MSEDVDGEVDVMFKTIIRSWGSYTELFRCKWLCVKVLNFVKGKQLSVQRHKDRAELWIWKIRPGEWHTFLPAADCRVLEIQYGRNVMEDDIERV